MYVGIVAIARSTVKNISSLYLLATWGAIPFSPPHAIFAVHKGGNGMKVIHTNK